MSELIHESVKQSVQPGHLDEFTFVVSHACYFSQLDVNSSGEIPEVRYVKVDDEEVSGPDGQPLDQGESVVVGVYNASAETFEVEVIATFAKAAMTEPPTELHEHMEAGDVAQFVVSHPEKERIIALLIEYESRESSKAQDDDKVDFT